MRDYPPMPLTRRIVAAQAAKQERASKTCTYCGKPRHC